MKKFFALLLAVLMVAALAACGGEPASTEEPKTDKNADFIRGVWVDNVYSNEFLDLSFTMPEGWVSASDEELAEIMGVVLDQTQDTNAISKEFLSAKVIFDMMAQDATYGTNITLQAENMALTLGGSSYTEEEYVKQTVSQLEKQGLTCDLSDEVTETTIGSITYKTFNATLYDGAMAQRYLVSVVGKYMVFLTVSYAPEFADIDTIMGQFSSVE